MQYIYHTSDGTTVCAECRKTIQLGDWFRRYDNGIEVHAHRCIEPAVVREIFVVLNTGTVMRNTQ